ncbi:SphA family protein [Pseudogulbenkiania subflava]|uniref:Uncharacterized conserved protein n=1 Tax=Pseudogulbenkiania subflava DSM 22618 TaxID=1123014 RepID=A0A1Y6C8J9_9NEIS|nr:transporter [Pseudogulbenkiania subflava]SMF49142.1 Uncharacterized conserved protein [Pseudogulbenkiania subflava DSM 22618]
MRKNTKYKLITGSVLLLASSCGFATENGGGMYPNGSENYLAAAVPPPGVYLQGFASSYHADELHDNSGNKIPVDFKVDANAFAPRLIWVTPQTVLGGNLVFHAIAPLVNLKVSVNGASQTKSGLGDMLFGTAIAYHASDKLHYVVGVDVNTPTGEYDKNNLANIGRNYWNVEPLIGVSYVQQSGINGDLKVMYDYNWKNKDTNYKSGQELHADYALGWGLGNGWVVGVGGYIYRQTTDDKGPAAPENGNRGQAFAIGPSIKYDNGKGFFVTAKWQKESGVENRAKGSEFKVKLSIPF